MFLRRLVWQCQWRLGGWLPRKMTQLLSVDATAGFLVTVGPWFHVHLRFGKPCVDPFRCTPPLLHLRLKW